MAEPYEYGHFPTVRDPAYRSFAITPSNTVDLPETVRRIWVGVAGNIKITMMDGDTITYTNVPVGYFEHFAVRVFVTGTTATGLIGVAVAP